MARPTPILKLLRAWAQAMRVLTARKASAGAWTLAFARVSRGEGGLIGFALAKIWHVMYSAPQ
jgi:hypothetical protein